MNPSLRALVCGFALANPFAAEAKAFRFRAEHSLIDAKAAINIREEARKARESGDGPQKGSHFPTMLAVYSAFARAVPHGNTYGSFGFAAVSMETIAKWAGCDVSTALRARTWLEQCGRIRTVHRFEKDARKDNHGEIVWKSRTNFYVVILTPLGKEELRDAPPILGDADVIEIAASWRNIPTKIAQVLQVLEEAERAEHAGSPLPDTEVKRRLHAIGDKKEGEDRSGAGAPPADAPGAAGAGDKRTRPLQGADKAPPPVPLNADASVLADFEAFASLFREERRAKYGDDLIGDPPSAEHQHQIGAYVRDLARWGCETVAGYPEDKAFTELGRELARQYVRRAGRKQKNEKGEAEGDGFLNDTGHRIADLADDLTTCGKKARGRWGSRHAAPAPTADPPAPQRRPRASTAALVGTSTELDAPTAAFRRKQQEVLDAGGSPEQAEMAGNRAAAQTLFSLQQQKAREQPG